MSDERAKRILDAAHRVTAKDDGEGNLLVNTYQDVEPAMDYAAAMRRRDREERGAFGKRADLHMTMSVPFNIIQKVCLENGLNFFDKDDAKKILAILKRDYPAFRTTIDRRI